MSEVRLDRKRSYGTVYNHPSIGFVQDGVNFRHDGTAHVETVKALEPAPGVTDVASATLTSALTALTERLDSAIDKGKSTTKRPSWDGRFKRASETEDGGDAPEAA